MIGFFNSISIKKFTVQDFLSIISNSQIFNNFLIFPLIEVTSIFEFLLS